MNTTSANKGHERMIVLVAVTVVLLATSMLALGCGSATTTTGGGQATTTSSGSVYGPASSTTSTAGASSTSTSGAVTTVASGGAQVALQNFAFSPASVTVKVGDTVTWTNKDSTGHTVASDDGTTFTSPTMATGATFSFTFTKAGTYAYHCSIHPNMKGTVVVQ